jgi:nucleotide-binding universal stress UspA family protein
MQDTNKQNRTGEKMIKSILVPLDSSKSSLAALQTAIQIGEITKAKLKGLYIEDILRLLEWQPVELIGSAIGSSPMIPSSKKTEEQLEIENKFANEGNSIKKIFQDNCSRNSIACDFLIKRGNVSEIITEESRKVDLAVIGRRGSDTYPAEAKEPGPTTENLLRHTTRPVIVAPPGSKFGNKILIAYDGSKTSQRALMTGALFASVLKSEVKVVSVADDIDTAQKPLDEAKEFLSNYDLKTTYVVDFGFSKPWKPILEQADGFKAGLIVLGAFGDNKLLELIFGSTTKEVLMKSKCPVLLAR